MDYTTTEHSVSTAEDVIVQPSHPGDSPFDTRSQYFTNPNADTEMTYQNIPGYASFVNNLNNPGRIMSSTPATIKPTELVKPAALKYLNKYQKPETSKLSRSPRRPFPKLVNMNTQSNTNTSQDHAPQKLNPVRNETSKSSARTMITPIIKQNDLRVRPGDSSKLVSDILHERDELREDVYLSPPLQRMLISTPPRPRVSAPARKLLSAAPSNNSTKVTRLNEYYSTAVFVDLLLDVKFVDWKYEYNPDFQKWCIAFTHRR